MKQTGALYGVGTGPGDPELLTIKAVRVLESCDVVAHFAKRGNVSNARRAVAAVLPADMLELCLAYPVTTELDKHSDGYIQAIAAFFDAAADALRAHLVAGRKVAVLSEGDPLFYGSYMHLHLRLASEFRTEVIPGITAMSGCWSAVGLPIIQGEDSLTVLAGTLDEDELTRRLRQNDAAVIMKVGRNLAKIRRALRAAGKYERAVYVERGTMSEGFHLPLADKHDEQAPYFSLLLVPGWVKGAALNGKDRRGRAAVTEAAEALQAAEVSKVTEVAKLLADRPPAGRDDRAQGGSGKRSRGG